MLYQRWAPLVPFLYPRQAQLTGWSSDPSTLPFFLLQKRRKSGSLPGGRMTGMSQELTDHSCKPSFLPLAWGTPHISKERQGSEGLGAGVRGDSLGIDLNFLLPCFHPPKCHWAGSSCSLQLHWNVRLCSGDGIVPWAPQCL